MYTHSYIYIFLNTHSYVHIPIYIFPHPNHQVAGGEGISVTQPSWSKVNPGVLYFVSDESDWWNLYAEESPGKVGGGCNGVVGCDGESVERV